MYTEELFPFAMNPYNGEYSLMDYLCYQGYQTTPEIRESENIPINTNIETNIDDDYIIINPFNTIIHNYFTEEIPEEINDQENILDIPNNLDIPREFDIPDEIIEYLELGITEIPITHDMLCGDNHEEAALAIQEAWRSYALYL